jgi:hypothetical protein
VNPIPQLGMPPYTESTNKASINTKTGEITLKDAAVAGDVISFVGILNDPYLGQIIIPGYITVVVAPEPEPHTCDYEGYAVIPGNMGAHYRVCECGKKKTETHSFTEFTSESGGQTVSKFVCPCGLSYSKTVDTSVAIHVHSLEYAYDDNNHWQICTDENCTDEYSTDPQAHSFEHLTDDSGKECNVCTVCKYFVSNYCPECGSYCSDVCDVCGLCEECCENCVLGDISGDGTVDINDALDLFRHTMMPELYIIEYSGSIDFNKDGSIDVEDALLIFLHSMLPDIYPIS